jgi:hypothetical protein
MREIKIAVIDTDESLLGYLDLENFQDFPLTLTKSISDINDLEKRSTDFSLDFDLPTTTNNNKLLFGVTNVNANGDTLKFLNRNKCRIFVDDMPISTGFIRIEETTLNENYRANFTGGNGDWVDLLSNVYLNQLEWVAETNSGTVNATETFSVARASQVNSLSNDFTDIVYPSVIRDVISETDFKALRPQIYVRSVVLRMFEKIGYTVAGSWIDSDDLTEVVDGTYTHRGATIDPSFNFTADEDAVNNSFSEYVSSNTQNLDLDYALGNDGFGGVRNITNLSGFFDDSVSDDNLNYNNALGEYTVPITGVYDVNHLLIKSSFADINGTGTFDFIPENSLSANPPTLNVFVVRNNVGTGSVNGEVLFNENNIRGRQVQIPIQFKAALSAGDKVSIFVTINDDANVQAGGIYPPSLNNPSLDRWRVFVRSFLDFSFIFQPPSRSSIFYQLDAQVNENEEYVINAQITENINCLALLQDFRTCFNLFFTTDFLSRTVTIESRDNFYQNIGASKNITDQIDFSKSIIVNSEKQYNRELKFRYLEDTDDGYLERWQKINNRTYGEYTHEFGESYQQGVDIIETKVLSPTIQGIMPNDNIVASVIRREYKDQDEPESVNSGYNTRIFYTTYGTQLANGVTRNPNFSNYAWALMEPFAGLPTPNNAQLTFNGENGLFSRFWAKTIANLEDKRVVELYLNMPLFEFQALDFSKPVYIDFSVPHLHGYYVFERIDSYKLESEETVKVRLLKFRNYDPVAVDTSQKTNISDNVDSGQGGDFEPIYYIFDEGTVNENYEIVFDIDSNSSLEPLIYQ